MLAPLLAALLAAADPAPVPTAMDLDQAVAYALAHHPSAAAARARVASAAAEARIPGALWLPRVAAGAQLAAATENNTTAAVAGVPGVDLLRIGGTRVDPSASLAPYPSTLAAAGVRQELYDFGRIAALGAAADALLGAERDRAREGDLDLRLAVEEAYFAVRAARSVEGAAAAALQRARAHRDFAAAGVKAQLRQPIELTRAEADLARAEVAQVRAQSGVTATQALFAAAVGVEAPLLDVSGEPPPSPPIPSLEEARRSSGARDPELQAREALVRAQQARTAAIDAELRPDLQVTAAVSARAGGAPASNDVAARSGGWLPEVPNWDAGLLLSWPILDFAVLARRDASRELESLRRAELDAARQRLSASVQQAYLAAAVSRDALPALERAAEAARQNQAQADARYRAGLASAVELADAEALRTDAEIQLAIGQFDLARARARLARATAETP
jgi:outer membrane protein